MKKVPVERVEHKLGGGQIPTWAGFSPWTKAICFGTESGRLIVKASPSEKSKDIAYNLRIVADPVNGAAFFDRYGIVTSRSEVQMLERRRDGVRKAKFPMDFGSLGAIPVRGLKSFVAPLGINGIAKFTPLSNHISASISTPTTPINLYRFVNMGALAGNELIAAACRYEGICRLSLSPQGEVKSGEPFGLVDLDVVDVASMHDDRLPYALLILGANGELAFVKDITRDSEFIMMMPNTDTIEGYGIQVIGGHGFVLTNDRLHCYPNIVSNLATSNPVFGRSFSIRADATDIVSTGWGRFALIEENKVSEFDSTLFARLPTVEASVKLPRSARGGRAAAKQVEEELESDDQQEPRREESDWKQGFDFVSQGSDKYALT